MEITRTAYAEHLELKLQGRMDATWSDQVARALAESMRSGQHVIVLEMSEVDYISSAGLRVLVLYARELKAIQGRLGIVNASSIVRKVLELSGLEALLQERAAPGAGPPAALVGVSRVALAEPGAMAEVFELEPNASLRVQWPGNASAWLEGRVLPEACPSVQFPANVMGVGLGALVSGDAANTQPFGEFLAAGGAALSQPADGSNKPDYLVQQGALTPTMQVAYGIIGQGDFRCLLRFDKGPQQPSLSFSSVVSASLTALGTDAAGLVIVAETAKLVGASLQKTPALPSAAAKAPELFSFPQIRDWLSFTAEAAFANSTCLMVGFAALKSRQAGLRLLKPLVRSGELYGHFHAAALPYRPLRKGKVSLAETLEHLFECEQVLGLLHLLNDWRDVSGVGESRLLRGACWGAPLTF